MRRILAVFVLAVLVLLPSVLWGYDLPIVKETGLRMITIEGIREVKKIGEGLFPDEAKEGYHYMIFSIAEKNLLKTKIPCSRKSHYELRIVDVSDFIYEYDYEYTSRLAWFSTDEIMPGKEVKGEIAFEVQDDLDIRRMVLVYNPKSDFEPSMVFDIVVTYVSVKPATWGEVKSHFHLP